MLFDEHCGVELERSAGAMQTQARYPSRRRVPSLRSHEGHGALGPGKGGFRELLDRMPLVRMARTSLLVQFQAQSRRIRNADLAIGEAQRLPDDLAPPRYIDRDRLQNAEVRDCGGKLHGHRI